MFSFVVKKLSECKICRFLLKVARSIFFIVFNFYKLIDITKTLEVKKLRPFKFIDWHDGYSYFTAYKEGKKVFIKIDLILHFLVNDYLFFTSFKDKIDLLPIIKLYIEDQYQVLISPFVEGVNLTEKHILDEPDLLGKIYKILEVITMNGVIHRDVRLDNFMLIEGKVFIIDFTFACTLPNRTDELTFKMLNVNSRYQKKILSRLGARINPKDYVWNDFYSVVQIIEKILATNKNLEQHVVRQFEKYRVDFYKLSMADHATYNLAEKTDL